MNFNQLFSLGWGYFLFPFVSIFQHFSLIIIYSQSGLTTLKINSWKAFKQLIPRRFCSSTHVVSAGSQDDPAIAVRSVLSSKPTGCETAKKIQPMTAEHKKLTICVTFFYAPLPVTVFEFLTERMKNEERLLFRACPPLGWEHSFPFLLTLQLSALTRTNWEWLRRSDSI